MNIRYLTHNEIDKKLWDVKISGSLNQRIYGYSGWLDIASPKWCALVSDNYDFVMPLLVKKKFGISYIAPAKFTQQIGIFSPAEISAEIISGFINSIPKKYKYLTIHFNSGNKFNSEYISEKPNHLLNLNSSYEALRKAFSTNTKRNIKKAKLLKFSLDKELSVEDAVSLKTNNNINSLSNNDLTVLKSLIHFVKDRFALKIYGIINEKSQLISVGVFSFCGNRISLPLIASSEEGKKNFASFLIFDAFIQDYALQNKILDFEGSALPGVARFFEGWGAKPEIYYCYKQNNLPLFVRLFKK
ncbi:MAG: hypothetical protein DRI94_02155 [Bacteroidetes bacterium]|nr:MAG: hypothetical protein DRI94_02155 [Bacteroidota bacterium]